MDRKDNMRAKLIIWLRDAIEHETDKPDDEIDYELADECSKLLSELMGDREQLTEEEMQERLAKIKQTKPAAAPKKPRFKLKRMIAVAACAALVLAGTTFAIGAFNPSVRNMVLSALQLGNGDSFNESGVTYEHMGMSRTYSSISELIDEEGLNINYPHILPDGIKIEEVIYNDIINNIVIQFNDDVLWMQICNTSDLNINEIIKNSTRLEFNNRIIYITYKNEELFSYTIIDDYIYMVKGNNEEEIKTILSGLYGE